MGRVLLFILPFLAHGLEVNWNNIVDYHVNEQELEEALEKQLANKIKKNISKAKLGQGVLVINDLIWEDHHGVLVSKKYWKNANEYCEKLSLAGINDWRLPTKDELLGIVDKTRKPRIVENFKYVSHHNYWSSTMGLANADTVWSVKFTDGSPQYKSKNSKLNVRCVSGSNYSLYDWYSKEINKWKE